MLPGWLALAVACAVAVSMLVIASYAERRDTHRETSARRRMTYALAVCGYCSSWTYFTSVDTASLHGLDFLPMYLGPMILFGACFPMIARIVRLSKGQNITSIADFVAVRYGKTTSVAVVVALIVTLGSIPFIATQILAISRSLSIFLDGNLPASDASRGPGVLTACVVSGLAIVTIRIGTRRLAASDPQRGLILAVAAGSVAKLIAFLSVGAFVCWGMFRGVGDLTAQVAGDPRIARAIDSVPKLSHWVSATVFSFAVAAVLPFAFYVGVVGNRQEDDVRTAAWVVPTYVLALSFMIMPVAAAGLATFPTAPFDRGLTIFALPIHAHSAVATFTALVGALSAATAATIASTAALAIIVANDLFMPVALRVGRRDSSTSASQTQPPILLVRRLAVVTILAAAWLCTVGLSGRLLSTLAFVSLVCVIQIAPAAIGGLVWSRGTARGAITGCAVGVLVWGYTLLLPLISVGTSALFADGPLGFDLLRPTNLFGLGIAPFDQGVVWSLLLNALAYVGVSLTRKPNVNERLQARLYFGNKPQALVSSLPPQAFTVSTGDLVAMASLYTGRDTAVSQFHAFHTARQLAFDPDSDADAQILKFAETLVASTIGAASSRTAISHLLDRRGASNPTTLSIIDDIALEVHSSHDVLQHAIDIARDGMAVFDRDLRLVAWNRAYRDMFQFPQDLMRVGVPLDALVRCNAERGVYGPGPADAMMASRLEALTRPIDGLRLHSAPCGRVLEMHSVRLANGGLFFTYSDATAQVRSEADLEAENVTLEQRVRQRTEELQSLNFELAKAKAEAEDANVSKTRFLAAASHDLLQPLNAARLYTTSLRERLRVDSAGEDASLLATHIDASLEAVEDMLSALLEISHLDAGATKTEITTFPIESVLRQLQIEFSPQATEKGLRLRIAPSSVWVTSDKRLLSRMLQNFISNAIKYTTDGGVLVGVRRSRETIRIEVLDSGLGIPASKQGLIFREFERLPPAARVASGAGLGLSIVERLGRVLNHTVMVRSRVGRGSIFSVTLPRARPVPVTHPGPTTMSTIARQRSLEGLVVAAIDNERHILTGMEMLLQGWDCIVATGTGLSEIEAELSARDLVPDVILADFHIGDLDGLGIVAALRTRFAGCPAVLITADRDPSIRDRAADADIRVLNKPLKPAALRALLSQWRLVKAAAE